MVLSLRQGQIRERDEILRKLIEIQYDRNDVAFTRGKFRVRGDVIEVYPAGANEKVIRISLFGDEIEKIQEIDSVTGEILSERKHIAIYPASHFVTSRENLLRAAHDIETELDERLACFKREDRLLEAQRIEQRTRYDLEMMQEMGYCSGIENYSRHLTGRAPGESPFTLVDYFPEDFLIVIDESHVTMPQIHAMYNGDRSRKQSLVDFGFRLPSALDNRPLKFEEFEQRIKQIVYVSATPASFELDSATQVAQQIIRPTGLVDPVVEIRPVAGQIDDLMSEINGRTEANERVLVTTLTKKMAENLTNYFREAGIRVRYLHSEVETIERAEIIRGLRAGDFDVLVGINLLREGLDLPEVSLIGILDADKEGFLRSDTSLIQTIGRAARNVNGKVIMYADHVTNSMQRAIDETDRRRAVQQAYNAEHGITPTSIQKKVRDLIQTTKVAESPVPYEAKQLKKLTKKETLALVAKLEKDMRTAAKNLEFERAAELRDMIFELRENIRR